MGIKICCALFLLLFSAACKKGQEHLKDYSEVEEKDKGNTNTSTIQFSGYTWYSEYKNFA